MNEELIDRNPDVLGGTPVFSGTRVPVRILMERLEAGDRLDDFLDDYPTVKREQAVALIDWLKAQAKANERLLGGRGSPCAHPRSDELRWDGRVLGSRGLAGCVDNRHKTDGQYKARPGGPESVKVTVDAGMAVK